MATAQRRAADHYGFAPANPGVGAVTTALNAATTFLAVSFFADSSRTLNTVRAFASAMAGTFANGTGAATDWTCEVQNDSSGQPAGTNPTGGAAQPCTVAPNGSGWYNWSGFTPALAPGTLYWLVWKNAAATPGTNFPTMQLSGTDSVPRYSSGNSSRYAFANKATWNGTTWAVTTGPYGGFRVGYADGSFDGFPVQGLAVAGSAHAVFGSNEWGFQFQVPANAYFNVAGVDLYLGSNNGSPTGNLTAKLYQGTQSVAGGAPSLVQTSNTIPNGNFGVTGWYPFLFGVTQLFTPGQWVVATIKDSAADSSTAYFRGYEYAFDADANSGTLSPVSDTFGIVYFNGTTWAAPANSFPGGAVLLNSNGEFAASGGGPMHPLVAHGANIPLY